MTVLLGLLTQTEPQMSGLSNPDETSPLPPSEHLHKNPLQNEADQKLRMQAEKIDKVELLFYALVYQTNETIFSFF